MNTCSCSVVFEGYLMPIEVWAVILDSEVNKLSCLIAHELAYCPHRGGIDGLLHFSDLFVI